MILIFITITKTTLATLILFAGIFIWYQIEINVKNYVIFHHFSISTFIFNITIFFSAENRKLSTVFVQIFKRPFDFCVLWYKFRIQFHQWNLRGPFYPTLNRYLLSLARIFNIFVDLIELVFRCNYIIFQTCKILLLLLFSNFF